MPDLEIKSVVIFQRNQEQHRYCSSKLAIRAQAVWNLLVDIHQKVTLLMNRDQQGLSSRCCCC